MTRFYVIEGYLYEVDGEDGPFTTFSCSIGAEIGDKRYSYKHKFFNGHESVNNEDYCGEVILHSKQDAQAFIESALEGATFNLTDWEEIPEGPTLEERFDQYAREEDFERHNQLPF